MDTKNAAVEGPCAVVGYGNGAGAPASRVARVARAAGVPYRDASHGSGADHMRGTRAGPFASRTEAAAFAARCGENQLVSAIFGRGPGGVHVVSCAEEAANAAARAELDALCGRRPRRQVT